MGPCPHCKVVHAASTDYGAFCTIKSKKLLKYMIKTARFADWVLHCSRGSSEW